MLDTPTPERIYHSVPQNRQFQRCFRAEQPNRGNQLGLQYGGLFPLGGPRRMARMKDKIKRRIVATHCPSLLVGGKERDGCAAAELWRSNGESAGNNYRLAATCGNNAIRDWDWSVSGWFPLEREARARMFRPLSPGELWQWREREAVFPSITMWCRRNAAEQFRPMRKENYVFGAGLAT